MIPFTEEQVEMLRSVLRDHGRSRAKVIPDGLRLRVSDGQGYIVLEQDDPCSFALSVNKSACSVEDRFGLLRYALIRANSPLCDRIDFKFGRATLRHFSAVLAMVLYLLGTKLSEAQRFNIAHRQLTQL